MDVCLACPRHFYVTDVLGYACIKIVEAEDNPLPLTGRPAQQNSVLGPAMCFLQTRWYSETFFGAASPVVVVQQTSWPGLEPACENDRQAVSLTSQVGCANCRVNSGHQTSGWVCTAAQAGSTASTAAPMCAGQMRL